MVFYMHTEPFGRANVSPFPPGSGVSPASINSPRRMKICQAPSSRGHPATINGDGSSTEEVLQEGSGWPSEAETHWQTSGAFFPFCLSQTIKNGPLWYRGGASWHLHGLPGHSKVKFLHSHHPARFLCCRLWAGRGNFHALREVNPEMLFSWVRTNLQDAKCWS